MKNILKIFVGTILLVILFPYPATGQFGGSMFVSPEVQKDRTVTFRFMAPGADEVKLSAQFISGQQLMTKDEKGLWSITLGPVEPDIYPYGRAFPVISKGSGSLSDISLNK